MCLFKIRSCCSMYHFRLIYIYDSISRAILPNVVRLSTLKLTATVQPDASALLVLDSGMGVSYVRTCERADRNLTGSFTKWWPNVTVTPHRGLKNSLVRLQVEQCQ